MWGSSLMLPSSPCYSGIALDQQQAHQEASWKWRSSGSSPDLLKQHLLPASSLLPLQGPRLRLCLPLSSLLCWADGHFP